MHVKQIMKSHDVDKNEEMFANKMESRLSAFDFSLK